MKTAAALIGVSAGKRPSAITPLGIQAILSARCTLTPFPVTPFPEGWLQIGPLDSDRAMSEGDVVMLQLLVHMLSFGATTEFTITGVNDAGEGQPSEPVSVVAT